MRYAGKNLVQIGVGLILVVLGVGMVWQLIQQFMLPILLVGGVVITVWVIRRVKGRHGPGRDMLIR